jgi:hypothetical protein
MLSQASARRIPIQFFSFERDLLLSIISSVNRISSVQ